MKNEQQQPDPGEYIPRVYTGGRKTGRGILKIFLGYAAGVGKTYAMLEAANRRLAEGVDVVAALVETHGFSESQTLLEGIEAVPRAIIEYQGERYPQVDVDAVLARHPRLALIDDMASSNIPGSRHAKRYQDIEELLAARIDVYTTLNIQHLESLKDTVTQITGVTISETIPDQVINEFTDLELIDLPPRELEQRLMEGKVCIPGEADEFITKFFRKGNLTALRELAMRYAATRVDAQMRSYMQMRTIPGPWPAGEQLLVCIGPNPLQERLVRSARRLAGELKADWTVIYVETPKHLRLSQEKQDQISHTLSLAEELGGRSVMLTASSVAEAVIDFARRHNVTKILVGKPTGGYWQQFIKGSIVDQIIKTSGPIDVYMISDDPQAKDRFRPPKWQVKKSLLQYGLAVLLVFFGTLLGSVLRKYLAPTNLVMIYLLLVVVAALYLGRGPAILSAVLGMVVFDFFFVPPHLTLAVEDADYLLTFLGLLLVGLIISNLTSRVGEQIEAARRRERETTTLYALSRDLAAAADLETETNAVFNHAGDTFGRDVIILLPDSKENGTFRNFSSNLELVLDDQEMAVAAWVFQHGEQAGRGTETLSNARLRYLPLKTARKIVGVLGVQSSEDKRFLTPDQRRLFEAFASLTAMAIERVQLSEATNQVQILEATEKLQTALLNSISHDLRTPLVSITGTLTSLLDDQVRLDNAAQTVLLETAAEEAGRLNRLVSNLLDMTRLEAGVVQIHREYRDLQDVIGAALQQIGDRLKDRPVKVEIPPNLPLIPLDFVLLVHVFLNLIDNAIKYSPAASEIEISVRIDDKEAQVDIADRGIGIPEEDLTHIFQKFYRVQRPSHITGTGLGLSISKGLVEAHGGRIWANRRSNGGAIITVALPRNGIIPKPEGI